MSIITHPAGNRLLAKKNYSLLFVLTLAICTSAFAVEANQQWVARYNGPANGYDVAYDLAVRGDLCYVTGGSAGIGTSFDYATILYHPDGNQLWAARYNGDANSEDCAYAIAVDSAAYVYVTGGSYGIGTGGDYATIKYGSNGSQLWVARYSGPVSSWPSDEAYDIAVDNAGGVCVTGQSVGSGTSTDYATVKYRSSDGNELWVRRYNGPGNGGDGAYAVATDSSRNVYVTGKSYGSGTYYDYATIKYDTNGVEKWVRRYNGPGNSDDGANALAVDNSGNVYVTGNSTGSGTYYDYATIKYDTNGNQLWVARYNGPANSSDEAHALAVDASGYVYVTGESDGYGDYTTVKYNSDGNQLWVARYNGPGNGRDRAYALAVDSSGNVYVTGFSEDDTGSGSSDYATIKYDANGSQLWVKRYAQPGDCNDGAEAMALDMYGNVYVTGQSSDGGPGGYPDFATIKYSQQPDIIYVDASAAGANNGSTWANAYKYLQDALTAAVPYSGVSISVAQGTYRPDKSTGSPGGSNDRTATFQLKNGVAIYGGFPTGGGNWESRKPGIYQTILSGDIGVADINSDNSLRVVTGTGTNSSTILDGFIITAGNNDNTDEPYWGSGGGMYNLQGSPTITNCTFIDNYAMWYGGGMSNEEGSPAITNCKFIGNSSDYYGGAIYNYNNNFALINCIFSGNSAGDTGGGIFCDGGLPVIVITNCTFSSNSAYYYGGGMANLLGSTALANCVFWNNTATESPQIYDVGGFLNARYCDVQGGWSGTGNLSSNPLFVDADGLDNIYGTQDDNLRLSAGSPCIDAADNNVVPEEIETDLDGRSRFFDDPAKSNTGNGTPPIVDMGPYEYRLIRYVDAGATGSNNGSSWANAYKYLKDAIWSTGQGCEIWVAQGTYRPDKDTNHPSGTNDRSATFQLISGISIYGEFPSGGGIWASRDPNLYETILSGDIGIAGNNSDNSYHVVTGSGTNSTAILDGFTIADGNADGSSQPLERGGGMYNNSGSPTITNCTFSTNKSSYVGGGIFGTNNSRPTLTNCTFIGNSTSGWGGGMRNNANSNAILTNCTFIGNSASQNGGGMHDLNSSPTLTNCTFIGNSATGGGGIWNNGSISIMTSCTFIGNSSMNYGGGMYITGGNSILIDCNFNSNSSANSGGGIYIANGWVELADCSFSGNMSDKGDGVYSSDSLIIVGTNRSVSTTDGFYISDTSQIMGGGRVVIELGGEMTVDSNAFVDLNDPNVPDATGTIQCDGLLRIKDNGRLEYADVDVSRQAGGYFGMFLVEDNAQITNLNIYSDGDRFMDVNYATFTGTIANNRIYVTITEGQNGSAGGVLEARGLDVRTPACDFNDPNVLACWIDSSDMPDFNTVSWTLERLEVAPGAKVTLMDRFDSDNGDPEVLYAKELVLGTGSIVNVGTERLYYSNLSGDLNSIQREAQMGFSLGPIDCDTNEEFLNRVGNNNYTDPYDPNQNRVYIERITGLEPDPNGMMKMSNFEDSNGNMISARAKAEFAPACEEQIRIQFDYLFNTSDPCARIVVYLSDVPELLDPYDPANTHYIEVARISPPSSPLPGSAGSSRFGNFDMYVSAGTLDLANGTYVELELIVEGGSFILEGRGPVRSAGEPGPNVYVDNLNASVSCNSCSMCLDLDSSCSVEPADFLKVVIGTGGSDTPTCMEGFFSNDGYTDSYDTVSWDWTLKDTERQDRCGEAPLSNENKGLAAGGLRQFGDVGVFLNLNDLNDLLVSGKRCDSDNEIKMKDRFYVFHGDGSFIQCRDPAPNDRCNIRIVRGVGNNFYQINSEDGVTRLDNGDAVVPPGQITFTGYEPRYGSSATVYAGILGSDLEPYGRPVLDAAFDATFVYVVPVVVVPNGNTPYEAAAKIQLNTCQVVKLYDGPVYANDNQLPYRNSLREIELDSAGNVYVTNGNKINACDILWKFEPNDATPHRLELDPVDPCSPRVRAPTGMCVSSTKNMLYIASALSGETDPDTTIVRGFSTATLSLARSITIHGMQHVTSIAEDPVTNSLWVAGFNLNPDPQSSTFYDPYLAEAPLGFNEVNAVCVEANDLAMPLSICWTGALPAQELCGGADLTGNGTVNIPDFAKLALYWRSTNCAALNNCEGADLEPQETPDGDVDLEDLDVFAEYWLATGCQ